MIGIADDRQAAHALGVLAALGQIFLHRHGLRRDVLQRQNAVDRRPVGVLDDAVMEILLGFLLGRPAGDNSNRVAADLAALRNRRVLRGAHLALRLRKRGAGGLEEKSVAVAYRE